METFGQRLARLRAAKHLTQVEVAAELGLSRGHMAKMEKDGSKPSFEVLCALADFYNVSLDYLRYGNPSLETVCSILQDEEEIALIRCWRAMGSENQSLVAMLVDRLSRAVVTTNQPFKKSA
ncbi:helix-turn-helix domain-containing protein [Aristophania vespae]|uniref:helix-turn-helix domain-containing protein n=1 Tax=Aristophania vespae TaxID=2697033 RepID=UPI0023511C77|nr:helix-turn-helix domain-containing protein [Aristophania vespae]